MPAAAAAAAERRAAPRRTAPQAATRIRIDGCVITVLRASCPCLIYARHRCSDRTKPTLSWRENTRILT